MKIGILGGSFDPPHLGHLLISLQVKQIMEMDEIWLMPAHTHPFNKELSPVNHRLEMTKLLVNEYIKVSEYEIRKEDKSYTIDTLRYLEGMYPQDTFWWITGSDQLARFTEYKDWKKLATEHNMVIFPRETMLADIEKEVTSAFRMKDIPKNIIVLKSNELVLTNLSSTILRHRIKKGEPVDYMTPQAVIDYIVKHGLYKK